MLASYGKKRRVATEGNGGVPEARTGRARNEVRGNKGGRAVLKYQDAAFIHLLTRIWEDHGGPCGKLLAAMIRDMIDFLVSSKEPD